MRRITAKSPALVSEFDVNALHVVYLEVTNTVDEFDANPCGSLSLLQGEAWLTLEDAKKAVRDDAKENGFGISIKQSVPNLETCRYCRYEWTQGKAKPLVGTSGRKVRRQRDNCAFECSLLHSKKKSEWRFFRHNYHHNHNQVDAGRLAVMRKDDRNDHSEELQY